MVVRNLSSSFMFLPSLSLSHTQTNLHTWVCTCTHAHTHLLTPCPALIYYIGYQRHKSIQWGENSALGLEDRKVMEKLHIDLFINCGHSYSLHLFVSDVM